MKKQLTTSKSGALSRFFKATFPAGLLAAIVLSLSGHTSQAGSATWKTSPGSGDWNTASNWTPSTIPNSSSDTATFGVSNTTDVALSASTEVSGIVFDAGANAFTITASPTEVFLTISGVGITNNSGITQKFLLAAASSFTGILRFMNSATAGNMTLFSNDGFMIFLGNSSAGNGTFINSGGVAKNDFGGSTRFLDTSTAGNGTFSVDGGAVSGAHGGQLIFYGATTAASSTITVNGGTASDTDGGELLFFQSSSAGNATIIANGGVNGGSGGSIIFEEISGKVPDGGTARIELFGNGRLYILLFGSPGITVGSIEGDGNVFLGSNRLTVGSNNLSTKFSGVMQDDGTSGGIGGSLNKIGTGKLVLSHRNFYTGGTTIKRGRLVINNIGGSGTGSGPVQVNRGKLGGKGEIAGAVTVGTGTGSGAVLAPGYLHGIGSPGALTIQSPLTFNSDATYEVGMNSSSAMADEVVALGITINSGARFAFADIGSGALSAGTVFTAINNTAATPIAGTFSNLADGSIFTSNGNSYTVDYQGGDGNDLTLKVVP